MIFSNQKIYFVTLTIQNWVPIFYDIPETHFIVIDSFKYLCKHENVEIYSFIIMKDHLHFIWKCPNQIENNELITKFKKYTGLKIVKHIQSMGTDYINNFTSSRQDRKHKIWKIRGGAFHIKSKQIFLQKLFYIHNNPTKGDYKVVESPEEYLFSSAKSYLDEVSNFSFLTLVEMS